MLNSKHYIPILKWKRAEQGALEALSDESKNYITPLIQFVMPKQKPQDKFEDIVKKFEEKVIQIPKKITEVWGKKPIFVDFSLLFTTELKISSMKSILRAGQKIDAVFIPVIHLNDEYEIKKIASSLAKKTESGLCLRLICPDFSDPLKLNQNIAEFISKYRMPEEKTDILIDIKELKEDGNKYIKYFNLSQKILDLLKWRSFIFASGSFPEDLSKYKMDEENLVPRLDWKNWMKKINTVDLKRIPSFSDYTIQYPVYKEISQFFYPTCSIKYTIDDAWFIMKGQKLKFGQYLAHAADLVKDKKFYQENFSFGDKYIAEKANHFLTYIKNPEVKGTGSTETWLKAGINHHLALVAHQVANLP